MILMAISVFIFIRIALGSDPVPGDPPGYYTCKCNVEGQNTLNLHFDKAPTDIVWVEINGEKVDFEYSTPATTMKITLLRGNFPKGSTVRVHFDWEGLPAPHVKKHWWTHEDP